MVKLFVTVFARRGGIWLRRARLWLGSSLRSSTKLYPGIIPIAIGTARCLRRVTRHRDGLHCHQTHAFFPTMTLPAIYLIGTRKLEDPLDLNPNNHHGFRSDKKSAWHIRPMNIVFKHWDFSIFTTWTKTMKITPHTIQK